MSHEFHRGPDHAARVRADVSWQARLLGALPDLWFRISADNRFLAWGGPEEDLYARPDAFLGRTIVDVLPPDVAARQLTACARARAGEQSRVEYVLDVAGAERSFVAVTHDAGNGEVAMFVREVTARVQAERRVADSERRFRAVVDVANEGVWVLDADGFTTFVTERMAAMLSRDTSEILGRSPLEFIAQPFHDVVQERLLRGRSGDSEPVRVVFAARDGDVEATIAATAITDEQGRYVGSVGLVTDEREAARRERELAESRRLLGTIAEVHDDVLYVGELLEDGTYVELFTGPGNERLLGGPIPPGVPAGDAWFACIHPDHRDAYEAMNDVLLRGEAADAEYLMIGYDGVERWVHDRAVPRPIGADGRVLMDGISTDITARREQADRLRAALAELHEAHEALAAAHLATERLARTDSLTGVANRRAFGERAAQETERADRAGEALGLVLLDVDHFKRVNDTYGHDVGDEVLVAVAERLSGAVRAYDAVARWGGEEFIVLVAGVPDAATLAGLAESLLCAVREQPIATSAGALRLTASAGTALRPAGGDLAVTIDAADNGLYAAKRRGRDRVFAGDTLHERGATLEEHEAIRLAEGLANAVSIRAAIPPQHCAQVADVASRIAAEVGLDADGVLRCRLAGWLHDIGQLALAEDVLRAVQEGAPDDAQLEAFRRHPEVGATLVAGMPSLASAAGAVHHHRERFGGGGYPDGLHGEQIPLEARIVAAAEAYVTLVRGPRGGVEAAEVREALQAQAGVVLDPVLVQVALRLLPGGAIAA